MKQFLYASLAATALISASAAIASPHTPTITQVLSNPTVEENEGQLATHINADDIDDGDVKTVYGSTGGAPHDVLFTANTGVNITGGGFALINDITGPENFTKLIINPNDGFSQLDFSIQLIADGTFSLYYSLSGQEMTDFTKFATISQVGSSLFDYIIDGNGLVFDAIRIVSDTPIDFEKQNSITMATTPTRAVPEPGTWGMMLLGFAGMGIAVRRSRRLHGAALMQVA